jgi:hypothetical protein
MYKNAVSRGKTAIRPSRLMKKVAWHGPRFSDGVAVALTAKW